MESWHCLTFFPCLKFSRPMPEQLFQRIVRICLWSLFLLTSASFAFGAELLPAESPEFRLESPSIVLQDIPVPTLRIVAVTVDGSPDSTFSEECRIQGVQYLVNGVPEKLPAFEKGVLELHTDRIQSRLVILNSSEVTVTDPNGNDTVILSVRRLPGWVSLIPPLLAIILAIWWQEVVSALLLAAVAGMLLLADTPFQGIVETVDPLILTTLTSSGNVQVILFTMLLGAMIGMMAGSGGSQALVATMTTFVKTRRQGQVLTWVLGLAVFFDDYGNTLLVGSTMRPIVDRLRISREKLAYLVDSTAAPVAGLALISTWVGVEVGYLQTAYEAVGLPTETIYQTFVATLPYRLYPLLTLIFVGQIAWTGRDFGAMRKAEFECLSQPAESEPANCWSNPGQKSLARHAFIPLTTLCISLAVALWIDFNSSSRALLLASLAATFSAVLSIVGSRTLPLGRTIGMGIEGMQQMLPAVVVLVLAWSLGTVCNPEHLNTAGYLVETMGDQLSPRWLPLITFLLAAVVSFSTGTSYGTMGLLIPLAVGVEFQLLLEQEIPLLQITNHPLMLGTIGAVLAGAIFGDHCSPISDTTVLTSAATGCDHLSHVRTQLPYALTVGAVSILFGFIPIALGLHPLWAIMLSALAQYVIIRISGRESE